MPLARLESCRSEAIGGGYGGDGSVCHFIESDAHPKLVLKSLIFLSLKRFMHESLCFYTFLDLSSIFDGCWQVFGGFWRLETSKIMVFPRENHYFFKIHISCTID